VQLLLDFGADASIENVYKKRALHYADATTQVQTFLIKKKSSIVT
jgi:hypothetical protein